jgi:hypothetical protein
MEFNMYFSLPEKKYKLTQQILDADYGVITIIRSVIRRLVILSDLVHPAPASPCLPLPLCPP